MRALVTGARGFIGRRLTPRLAAAGWEVVAYEGDVRGEIRCAPPVDAVVHLAGVLRGDAFRAAPARAFETNVVGTANVLRFCERDAARCVLASSSAVYASSAEPLAESIAVAPDSPYGMSKWLAERLGEQAARAGGVSFVALRLFNVYGPGQEGSFLVPYVVDCLRHGRAVELRSPQARRDFVHVDDVAAALHLAAASPSAGARVYNVGSGRACRVADLVELAAEGLGVRARLSSRPDAAAAADCVVAQTAAIERDLGWRARVDLRDGLRALLAGE